MKAERGVINDTTSYSGNDFVTRVTWVEEGLRVIWQASSALLAKMEKMLVQSPGSEFRVQVLVQLGDVCLETSKIAYWKNGCRLVLPAEDFPADFGPLVVSISLWHSSSPTVIEINHHSTVVPHRPSSLVRLTHKAEGRRLQTGRKRVRLQCLYRDSQALETLENMFVPGQLWGAYGLVRVFEDHTISAEDCRSVFRSVAHGVVELGLRSTPSSELVLALAPCSRYIARVQVLVVTFDDRKTKECFERAFDTWQPKQGYREGECLPPYIADLFAAPGMVEMRKKASWFWFEPTGDARLLFRTPAAIAGFSYHSHQKDQAVLSDWTDFRVE